MGSDLSKSDKEMGVIALKANKDCLAVNSARLPNLVLP